MPEKYKFIVNVAKQYGIIHYVVKIDLLFIVSQYVEWFYFYRKIGKKGPGALGGPG